MKLSEFIQLIRDWAGFANAGAILFLLLWILILSFKIRNLKKKNNYNMSFLREHERIINSHSLIIENIIDQQEKKSKKSFFPNLLDVKLNDGKNDKEGKIKIGNEKEMIDLEKKGKIFQEKVKNIVKKGK